MADRENGQDGVKDRGNERDGGWKHAGQSGPSRTEREPSRDRDRARAGRKQA